MYLRCAGADRGLLSAEYVYTGGRTRDTYLMYYSDGLMVKRYKIGGVDDIYYRGPDQGGGVAGINYAEKSDGTGLNYKFYNLRGDVVRTENASGRRISQSRYEAFGEHTDLGSITTDTFTANTKEENSLGLLNEGKRWRSLKYGVFLTPDPLEYVDGFNPYIYCNQNPWGRWDPLGLESWNSALYKNPKLANDLSKATARNLDGAAETSETALDVMMAATPVSIVGKSKKAASLGKLIYNKIKTEISESAAAAATQLKKASEAATKAVDNAEGVIKNQLTNPESFTVRAAENRLTSKELIGVVGASAGIVASAVGVNDDTAGVNGADIPVVGQVAGAAFSVGHASVEVLKDNTTIKFGTEKTTQEKTDAKDVQASNEEKE